METLLQDLRYAMRGLRRAPGFAIVALLTIALGIGVNSSIFSVVNAILFRPLPVQQPATLVDIYGHQASDASHETSSYPNYLAYREQSKTLSSLIGYTNFFAHFSVANSAEMVIGELVTDGYFQTLGIPLQKGRTFSRDEFGAEGAGAVAVISHRMWQKEFAGAPDAVGRTFRMNGVTYTIVGIASPTFGGMVPAVTAQMWIPITMAEKVEPIGNNRVTGQSTGSTRLERRGQHWFWLKGRMRADVTPSQVQAEMTAIAARLATEFPATNARERLTVVPSADVRINPDVDKALQPAGFVLLAAVGLVLLVACANLANLLLARAAGRRREVAVRLAVGASRKRLVRQFLTESMLLSIAGGAVAIPIAMLFARTVERVRPPLPMDFGLEVSPDWRVLLFTLLVAVATGVIFGLVPALRATRPDLVVALKGGGVADGKRRRVELRDTLVVLQVAVSLILVVGGALLVRSLAVAGRVNLGFDANRRAFVSLALEMNGYDAERGGRFLAAAQQRLQGLPGVERVALTSRLPLSLNNNGFGVIIPGRQTSADDRPYAIDGAYVDESYVAALDLRLLAGRNIDAADRDEERRVAVITRAMAERYFTSAANSVGREFRLRWGGTPFTVIGVVENYKVNSPGEPPMPYIHLPLGRHETFGNFIVKTTGDASPMVAALERELRAIDPSLVFLDRGTLRSLADVRLFPVRAGAWLIGTFGLLALAVAAIGLYGVIGYSVSRRTHEIGVRKALGAQPRQLVRMVMREGMTRVLVGGAIGGALAAGAARVLATVLYVGPFDAASFALAFVALALVALAANGIPALRASRVDAMVAMREQ